MRSRRCLILVILVLGLLALCPGCNIRKGSGVQASEKRTPPAFTSVHLHGSGDVTIQVGGEQSVTLTTDDNLLEIITTEVEGETLMIRKTESYSSKLGVKLTITVPTLRAIQVSGSGDITAQDVQAAEFGARVNGSGDIVATGSAEILDVNVNGSGDADLSGLTARMVSANVNGSGDILVNAADTLSAVVSGSGDIQYRGSPEVQESVSGSGKVSPASN